ncbi:hypothetical protein B0H13DRAFT_2379841 [Mycena leptocephala]|nr:hypothetical protein B0H13DRAFT_2379841 [Mycena leptocephala]
MREIAVVDSRPYQIASVRTVTKTRRVILIDLGIALGIPLLWNTSARATATTSSRTLPRRDLRDAPYRHLPSILIGAISVVYWVRIKSFYRSRP